MMIRCFLMLLGFVLSFKGVAQTILSNVEHDTTWTKAGNPYLLKHNIQVARNATLTIQPGVKIYGDKNTLITVLGTMNVAGSRTDSILFSVNNLHPNDSNFYGIRLDSGASVDMKFVQVFYAKRFLELQRKTSATIRHASFQHCKTAIYSDSLAMCSIDSCFFGKSIFGIEKVFRSPILRSTFDANAYGIGYSNGCFIKHCIFKKNSEKGLVGKYSFIAYNQFLNHPNIGMELAMHEDLVTYLPTQVVQNRLEYNEIGVAIVGGIPTAEFTNNFLCHNRLSVFNTTSYSPKLNNNCWCGLDSLSIRQTIYDRYKNMDKGVVTYLPISTGCDSFELVRHSINGKAISSSPLHQLWLYRVNDGKDDLVLKQYCQSDFSIKSLQKGEYKIVAIALNSDSTPNQAFLPTVYAKKTSLALGFKLPLKGDFYDVNIQLLASQPAPAPNTVFFRLEDLNENWLFLIQNKEGNTAHWQTITASNTFSTPLEAGIYTIKLLGKNGEFFSVPTAFTKDKHYLLSLQDDQVKIEETLGIPIHPQEAEKVAIFPNKLEDQLTIRLNDFPFATATFSNTQGAIVHSQPLPNQENKLSVGHWPPGTYLLRIANETSIAHFKLIK